MKKTSILALAASATLCAGFGVMATPAKAEATTTLDATNFCVLGASVRVERKP